MQTIPNYMGIAFALLPMAMPQEAEAANNEQQPNVILVMSDDQGIGGLGCQGNPYLKTPAIDQFYQESLHITDFHVSPLSTPTRGAIMTGRYPIRNGAWATFKGRDIVSRNTPTIAELFRNSGYTTALFGKWHLGDNYPSRPTDSGFDHVVQHRSGGVGELSDYWGNTYFDDTYWVNNEPTHFEGYCTDVWFDQTIQYIERQRESSSPFFIYLATNAPHDPHYVDEKYSAPYEHLVEEGILKNAGFYGQIANLDENFGKLEHYLSTSGLRENTIVIFLTDNGALAPNNAWVCGYRGAKGTPLEGGHRVPFFIRWPEKGIEGGRDISALVGHVDLLPTLAALCGVEVSNTDQLDGVDFSPLLLQRGELPQGRTMFIHHRQDSQPPHDVKASVVMRDSWRLVNGQELYNLENDRVQKQNVAAEHPQLVAELLAENGRFIAETKELPEYQHFLPAIVGTPHQQVIELTIQHAIGADKGLWKSEQIAEGIKNKNNGYALEFAYAGNYRISLARWPRECQGEIWGIPAHNPKGWFTYQSITPQQAEITLAGKRYTQPIETGDKEVHFEVTLPQGAAMLTADFVEDGNHYGAYYVYVEKL